MHFDQKLYALRKEKGLSQEALADQLNTTRQAISKWENGQGFPEVEKLIMLSNILGVSTDELLKDSPLENEQGNSGYYVSKEQAQSWLWHKGLEHKRIGVGVVFLLSAWTPFLLIPDGNVFRYICSILLVIIGLSVVLTMCLDSRDYEDRQLKRNTLVFDPAYLIDLQGRYVKRKKGYVYLIIISFACILLGAVGLFIKSSMSGPLWTMYRVIYTIIFAASIGCLQYGFGMIDAYELLVHNDAFINKTTTRVANKVRAKMDALLRK